MRLAERIARLVRPFLLMVFDLRFAIIFRLLICLKMFGKLRPELFGIMIGTDRTILIKTQLMLLRDFANRRLLLCS